MKAEARIQARMDSINTPRSILLIFFALFFSSLSLLCAASASSPAVFPSPATPPYRSPNVLTEVVISMTTLEITSPPQLRGVMMISPSMEGGKVFQVSAEADAAGNYDLILEVQIPHSADDIHGCSAFTRNVTDEGVPLAGKMLMIQRKGGCQFNPKVYAAQQISAAAALLQNCDVCSPDLIRISLSQDLSIPAVFNAYTDGELFRTYLLQRRAAMLAFQVNGTSIPVELSQPLLVKAIGTGKTKPAEIAALREMARSMTITALPISDYTALRNIADLVTNPDLDPCIDPVRIVGLWCERGSIHTIAWAYYGLKGFIPPAIGAFTSLKQLLLDENIPQSEGIHGTVPAEICNLKNLTSIQLEGNALTSVPDCLGLLDSLLDVHLDRNLLTALPPSLSGWRNSMVFFTAPSNNITTMPLNDLLHMRAMNSLDLSQNPLAMDVSSMDFTNWLLLQGVYFHDTLLFGSFQPGAFNNLPRLNFVSFAHTRLTGGVPDFANCSALSSVDFSYSQLSGNIPSFRSASSLTSLLLSNNQFSGPLPELYSASLTTLGLTQNAFRGGIPTSWMNLKAMTSLNLASNRLTEPLDNLLFMSGLTSIDLSHNEIVTPSDLGDIGAFLDRIMPFNLESINLDSNRISGKWGLSHVNIPKIKKLVLSNNQIEHIPFDMWTHGLTYVDLSYNNLLPPIPDSINQENEAVVTDFYVNGNPNLYIWPLPTWLQFAEPATYVASADGKYECRTLSSPTSRGLVFKADPSFTLYNGCQCARGLFGSPPDCDLVPINANISPRRLFATSNETTLQNSNVALFSRMLNGVVDRGIADTNGTEVYSNVTGRFLKLNPSWSDNWYGDLRLTAGLSTYWSIDLTSYRAASDGSNETDSAPSVPHYTIDRLASHQPVREIILHLHISSKYFIGPANTLLIYNDTKLNQQGAVQLALSGVDWMKMASTSTVFTNTTEYQTRYRNFLATVDSPQVVEVRIPSSAASIYFSSRDFGQVHFVATYTYAYACSLGFYLSGANRCVVPVPCDSDSDWEQISNTCVPKVHTSLLPIVLGVSGFLLLLLMIWLLRERIVRQRSKQARDRRVSLNSKDGIKNVEEEVDLDDDMADMSANAVFCRTVQRRIDAMRREFWFNILVFLIEIALMATTWLNVVQLLHSRGEAVADDHVALAYICIAIMSSLAFLVNSASKILGLLDLQRVVAYETNKLSPASLAKKSDSDAKEDKVHELGRLQRQILRLKIMSIALIFDALPVCGLNFYQLYVANSGDLQRIVSLFIGAVLVGAKCAQLAELVTLKEKRIQLRYEIFQANQERIRLQMEKTKRTASSNQLLALATEGGPSKETSPTIDPRSVQVTLPTVAASPETTSSHADHAGFVNGNASPSVLSPSRLNYNPPIPPLTPVLSRNNSNPRSFRIFQLQDSCQLCAINHRNEQHAKVMAEGSAMPSQVL